MGVSINGGASYSGFALDNNNWFIQSCPASGPDGIMIADSLYSVFLSNGKCYLSRGSMSGGALNGIEQLGASIGGINQNYPRIDHDGTKTAIVWRGISNGSKLMFSYSNDIGNGAFEIQDTLAGNGFVSADVAVTDDAVHIVWQDNTSGTVKYSKGTLVATNTKDISRDVDWQLYPNPTSGPLEIKSAIPFATLKIYSAIGELILEEYFTSSLPVSQLPPGQYILECITKEGKKVRKTFTKE